MRRSLLLIVFCVLFLFSGCRAAEGNRAKQWNGPFTAAIEGTRGELAFSAELTVTSNERTIRYTAPESLAGLTATATANGIRIVQGELSKESGIRAAGLFLPLDLLTASAELATVQMREGETVLSYMDGTEVILNRDGTPKAVIRSDLFFTVSDFLENKPQTN